MEYSDNEPQTPSFGHCGDNNTLFDEPLVKRITKSTYDKYQNVNKNEKVKNKKKQKSQSKEKSKNKEKSKSRHKSSKSKNKKISGKSTQVEQNYVNPLDIFLKKKLKLRNDFDQNNSEKFLSEKELAFQQFQMNEDDDSLDKNIINH